MKTADKARGKWRGILLALGIEDRFLSAKHGPCPFCEGRDRYRWDNDKGNGTFYCNSCGPGDGFELLKRAKGWGFKEAAREVEGVLGGVSAEPARAEANPKQRVEMLNRLWQSGCATGSEVSYYLGRRGIQVEPVPSCLRYVERCPVPFGGGFAPAMIALVRDAAGTPINIHRTFLGDLADGQKRQRAMMPGEIAGGAAVRLSAVHGARLGIAEGIETALAAGQRFNVPTWAAINATLLGKWEPPAGVEEVVVFGDCDPAFGGQAAAYALAHRLATRFKIRAEVRIPQAMGLDWADSDAA